MAIGNQMDMVTESAQHAQTTSASVSGGLQASASGLRGQVGSVIPAQRNMDQSVAFSNAHEKWQAGMANLIRAMDKIGVDTGSAHRDYVETDTVQTASYNRIEAPAFNGQLSVG